MSRKIQMTMGIAYGKGIYIMKKMHMLAAASALSAVLLTGACSSHKEGSVIGEIYTTDIKASLDGIPIPVVEIEGRAAVAIEDMASYGFILSDSAQYRRRDLKTDYIYGDVIGHDSDPVTIGEKLCDILYTGVETYINSVRIESYYNGVNTYVCIDDLCRLDDPYNVEAGFSDYNFNCEFNEEEQRYYINAFRFPDLDTDRILAEREELLCNKEFELYTEGSNDDAVYYGAKAEPRAGVLAGIVSDGNGNEYEGVPRQFDHDFGCYSDYMEYDLRETELSMPLVKDIDKYNCVLCIPWNTSDMTQVYDNDEYMRDMLDTVSKYNKPTIVRFAAEMNVSSLGDSPTAYVKAFRHVAELIHNEYPDIAVMWSPNDAGALNRPMSLYYPGDEYVDWIGISGFLKRDFMADPNSGRNAGLFFNVGDFAWGPNMLSQVMDFMEENNIEKPVAVSEGGVVTSMPYDNSDISAWAEPRLRSMYWYIPMKYPQVKLITYFNHTSPYEVCGYDLADKPSYRAIIDEAFENGPYLMEYPAEPKFTFVRADGFTAEGGILPLYAYSYIPEEETAGVSYVLDGQTLAEKTDIPYKYELDLSALSDGEHELVSMVRGVNGTADEYSYIIEKNGNSAEIIKK